MARYVITDAAKQDIRAIISYLRKRSPQAAARARQELSSAFQKLAEFPHIGHFRTDVPWDDLRFWSVYSYLVVYRPAAKPIQIIRVIHGAQDVPRFF